MQPADDSRLLSTRLWISRFAPLDPAVPRQFERRPLLDAVRRAGGSNRCRDSPNPDPKARGWQCRNARLRAGSQGVSGPALLHSRHAVWRQRWRMKSPIPNRSYNLELSYTTLYYFRSVVNRNYALEVPLVGTGLMVCNWG